MESRIQTVCLLLISAVALAGALYWLRPVMIPFLVAVVIYLGLSRLTDFGVRRLKIPRPLTLLATLILAVVLLTGIGTVISASVRQLAANSAAYQQQLAKAVEVTMNALPPEWLEGRREVGLRSLSEIPVSTVGRMLRNTTNAILDILSNSVLVLIFVFFLLLGDEGSRRARDGTWGAIEAQVTGYLGKKVAVSAVTGSLVGLVLTVLGVPLAMVFGLFAFLLNFIPSIGSIIATLLPLPVVVVSPEVSSSAAVAAIVLPGAIQLVIGNLVEPKIVGESLGLHPVTLLLALIFWGMLWGIVGMLLAAPITSILKILFEKLEPTQPLAELMGGRLAEAPLAR